MKLVFTPEQSAQIEPHLLLGRALLGRVTREPYDTTNPDSYRTCGRLMIELGSVPEASLPALRAAIRAKPAKNSKKKPTK